MMNGINRIPLSAITSITPEQSIRVFTMLLRAECRYASLSPAVLTLSDRLNTPDGGIDAQVQIDQAIPADSMFRFGRNGFQIKTGSSFKPWLKSALNKELLDSDGTLISEVKRLIEASGHYVLMATGIDLTPKQRNDSIVLIRDVFQAKGFNLPSSNIQVLGTSQIAGFIERYPSIVAELVPGSFDEGLTLAEWQLNAHMSNVFEPSAEQVEVIQQIRDALSGSVHHIRVLGEPGLGKSRLVLEALKDPTLAPLTFYVEHGSKFSTTSFYRQLIKTVPQFPIVLVLDELAEEEMSGLWSHLKSRCGALRIISIDHGRDESYDPGIVRIQASKLSDETIRTIISGYIGNSNDLDRWVGICEGSPRVAQAVGENLRANPEDILKPPSTIPLWDRYIHGYAKPNAIEARQIDCVTRYLALFSRFGYVDPVSGEARYIAGLIEKSDPSIGWSRFQEIIGSLRSRRVLQGSRTLFFVPRALHIYLWKKFWEIYGSGFNFQQTFLEMPVSLHAWFLSMFKYAESPTDSVVSEVLKIGGIFSSPDLLTSEKGSQFLSILAEANPVGVLRLLESTLGVWPDADLLAFKDHRQKIVWALEKIAVWKPYTVRACKLLARLSINENANYSNNSTGIFTSMFRIWPDAVATESSPQERLPALISLFRSQDEREKRLALKAMETALNTRNLGWRTVGPEFQGLKEKANLWRPETWGELWDASYAYLIALESETRNWHESLRPDVCQALLHAVSEQILVAPCTETAFRILQELLEDPEMSPEAINQFFINWFEYREDDAHPDIHQKLKKLSILYWQRNIASRFQRYVLDSPYHEWNEEFRAMQKKPPSRARLLAGLLAKRIASKPQLFPELASKVTPKTNKYGLLNYFGEQLAEWDSNRALLWPLIELSVANKHGTCLSGYLSALRSIDRGIYISIVSGLLEHKERAWISSNAILFHEYDENLFNLCLEALEKGHLECAQFNVLRYGQLALGIPKLPMERLLQILAKHAESQCNAVIIDILYDLPFHEDAPFDAKFVFDAITHMIPSEDDNRDIHAFTWKTVCTKLVDWDPSFAIPLLDAIFNAMKATHRLTYDSGIDEICKKILDLFPDESWQLIEKHFEGDLPKWRSDLYYWLKGGHIGFSEKIGWIPIAQLPLDKILAWVDLDPPNRAPLIAHAAPKSLNDDNGGKLTKELLIRYSDISGVKSGIQSVFHSGGWVGSRSAYLKNRKDKFLSWLAEGYPPLVNQFIEEEIEYLDRDIQNVDIEEERDHLA